MNSFRTRVSFAILTAATGALILAGCSNSPESASAPAPAPATTPSTSAPAAAPVVDPAPPAAQPKKPVKPAPAVRTLGPTGYGKLTLGMSHADAKAAGFVRQAEVADSGCQIYEMYTNGKRDGFVHISRERGVEAIGPDLKVRTPEGMEAGWTMAKIKKAYPEFDVESAEQLGRGYVGASEKARAVYRIGFGQGGVVSELALQFGDQTCYE